MFKPIRAFRQPDPFLKFGYRLAGSDKNRASLLADMIDAIGQLSGVYDQIINQNKRMISPWQLMQSNPSRW